MSEKESQRNIPSYSEFKDAVKYLRSIVFRGEKISRSLKVIAKVIELAQEGEEVQIITWGRYIFLTNFQGSLNEYQEGGVPALNNLTNAYLGEGPVSLYYFSEHTRNRSRPEIIEKIGEDLGAGIYTLDEIVEKMY